MQGVVNWPLAWFWSLSAPTLSQCRSLCFVLLFACVAIFAVKRRFLRNAHKNSNWAPTNARKKNNQQRGAVVNEPTRNVSTLHGRSGPAPVSIFVYFMTQTRPKRGKAEEARPQDVNRSVGVSSGWREVRATPLLDPSSSVEFWFGWREPERTQSGRNYLHNDFMFVSKLDNTCLEAIWISQNGSRSPLRCAVAAAKPCGSPQIDKRETLSRSDVCKWEVIFCRNLSFRQKRRLIERSSAEPKTVKRLIYDRRGRNC